MYYCCSFGLLLPLLLPIVLSTLNTVLFQTYSIHCDVCVPCVSSSTRSGLLYCRGAEKNMTSSSDDGRSTCGVLTATARTSAGHRPIILLLYTPLDLRPIIVMTPRWPGGDRPIFGIIFPRKIGRWPTGHRQMFGRHPGGRRQMA